METTTTNETALPMQRQETADSLNSLADEMRMTYIWVVFILGFPGNLFSIITVLTMQTLTPAILYVAVLALCDGLTLVAKLVGHQMATHEAYFGSVGCKAFFVTSYLSVLSNWMLVLICAERCVSVCLPLKKHIIFTKHRAYVSTLILTVVFLVIFSVMFCVMRDMTDDGLDCGTLDQYLHFWTNGWYWINTSLHLFVPLPIIVILTIIIIKGLRKSRRDRRMILQNGSSCDSSNARLLKETERLERNITVMLILVAIMFLVLSLPSCIYILTYRESSDVLIRARWKLFDQIQFICMDSSHAVNFFLYFLSAKKFREHFFFLITCHRWPKSLRKTTPNTYATKYTIAKSNEDVSRI